MPLAYVLLSAILRFLYGGFSGGLSSRSLGVIMHLTFPMFVFFSLFYYTDNGSLLSVILYLQLNLLEASLLVTVPVGFISLLFRQTNIIWLYQFYIATMNFENSFDQQTNNWFCCPITFDLLQDIFGIILLRLQSILFLDYQAELVRLSKLRLGMVFTLVST